MGRSRFLKGMTMLPAEAEDLFSKGVAAIDGGDTTFGLVCLEKIRELANTPIYYSYLAVCLAKEKEEFEEALSLLKDVHDVEPAEPVHYLNLGRVYAACGRKREAIRSLRDGLLFGNDARIKDELNRIGWRNPPIFSGLPREHFLNKYLGKLSFKLRLRRSRF